MLSQAILSKKFIFLATIISILIYVIATSSSVYISYDAGAKNTNDGRKNRSILPINSTLGFNNIIYINLPYRYDLDDAILLQTKVSGLSAQVVRPITADKLNEKGLPPSSLGTPMKQSVKSCFRGHMDAWRKVLEEDWETALILEADAVWDVNIREIMGYFSNGLYDLLKKREVISNEKPTVNDPYLHEHWDIINFGACFENDNHLNESTMYFDPYSANPPPPPSEYFGVKFTEDQRIVRWHHDPACLGAYAITRKAAMKLLLRHSIDMGAPVDNLVAYMIGDGLLDAYSVYPVIIPQWEFVHDIGADSKSTDNGDVVDVAAEEEKRRSAWKQAHETQNIWQLSGMFQHSRIRYPALFGLKQWIYKGLPSKDEKNRKH